MASRSAVTIRSLKVLGLVTGVKTSISGKSEDAMGAQKGAGEVSDIQAIKGIDVFTYSTIDDENDGEDDDEEDDDDRSDDDEHRGG
ncbi:hypothetical protein RclHR1_00710010 [Rhizophagus clarus]|uniref:Uncharacterized protein n=1 Tax=Rhizophagus clarus TaxID=94130 RepID=A0A2Z6SKL6_9GLOM|nr:hypothetical protein RclHR1_00710010 [Rhizophagus clarus]